MAFGVNFAGNLSSGLGNLSRTLLEVNEQAERKRQRDQMIGWQREQLKLKQDAEDNKLVNEEARNAAFSEKLMGFTKPTISQEQMEDEYGLPMFDESENPMMQDVEIAAPGINAGTAGVAYLETNPTSEYYRNILAAIENQRKLDSSDENAYQKNRVNDALYGKQGEDGLLEKKRKDAAAAATAKLKAQDEQLRKKMALEWAKLKRQKEKDAETAARAERTKSGTATESDLQANAKRATELENFITAYQGITLDDGQKSLLRVAEAELKNLRIANNKKPAVTPAASGGSGSVSRVPIE